MLFVIEYFTWDGTLDAANHTHGDVGDNRYDIATILDNTVTTFNLSALTKINKLGFTDFRFVITQRTGDAAPTGVNEVIFASADNTTGLPVPKLNVTWAYPSERLSPDTLISQVNLTGALTTIQDDPDAPDANWMVG